MIAAFAGSDEFGVPFQEAIDFFRQKLNLPSKTWRDIEGRSHDRAFVVAGAMKDALLSDLRAEIDKAVAGKTTLEEFRKNFDAIVARHGWTGWTGEGSEAGRAWRTRVIYETNLKTAYAAGRYAQMTDPDIVKVYKWWRYRHAFYRQPERARPEHRDIWNGTVLRFDDPWWDTHYPPNGWNCSCGVETLSDRELKAEGIEPDEAPPITTRTVIDPKTGEKVQVPNGIDFGWDHAPGRDWSRG
ncbi:MAG: head morphogenesis protein, partial [Proteobacteria bacterium]|nr:head morphogenesis protein [Pseudomonadota bacterium]MCA0425398.1 head morphogenesis protein [Pseudomonadota bacterium]